MQLFMEAFMFNIASNAKIKSRHWIQGGRKVTTLLNSVTVPLLHPLAHPIARILNQK